jgi:DNA-damage-inducible protein D
MQNTITSFSETMSRLRKTTEKDGTEIEYWSAREIYGELGYENWANFLEVIEKGKENCSKIEVNPQYHFAEVSKMVPIGSGAFREQKDYILSRTGCYLIALNAEASKEQIAWAKAYFIVQTRAQEVAPSKISDAEERQQLREKLKKSNLELSGAAKEAGVENFAFFHAAGIRSLYGMTMAELKTKKGISQKEEYWDRVCGLELSANEFKAQLAKKTIEQKKKSGLIHGQKQAEKEHERVGKSVRETIHKEAGIYLENLPPEPSLKKLLREEKKNAKLKSGSAKADPSPPNVQ